MCWLDTSLFDLVEELSSKWLIQSSNLVYETVKFEVRFKSNLAVKHRRDLRWGKSGQVWEKGNKFTRCGPEGTTAYLASFCSGRRIGRWLKRDFCLCVCFWIREAQTWTTVELETCPFQNVLGERAFWLIFQDLLYSSLCCLVSVLCTIPVLRYVSLFA